MGTSDSPALDAPTLRVSAGAGHEEAELVLDDARDTAETVAVVDVGPVGIEELTPLAAVTNDGTTAFHANCTPGHARTLVKALEDGTVVEEGAHAVVTHDEEETELPLPDDGPLAVGRRNVLGRCGWTDPTRAGGYDRFVAEEAADAPEAVLAQIETLGLLGRGRGDARMDEPIAEEWNIARETDGEPVVIVNGGETDDRNGTDRLLLEADPIAVLDGATAVAHIVGAEDIVVYVPESAPGTRECVRDAMAAFSETDAGEDVTIRTFAGPDMYMAAEPTMALEALEGNDRLEARLRPPSPGEYGLYGRPTIIHTPRTFAQVRRALRSPDAFDSDDADPGTRLMTVTGDVVAPATLELSTGGSLETVRDAVSLDSKFKMACVGGQFGGVTRSLDHTPSAPSITGAHLGTDGVVELFDQSRCAVATAGSRAKFAEEANCGRCVPCREGSKQLTSLMRDIYAGDFKDDMLRELGRTMQETSICEFGRAASRPVTTAMDEFEMEFRAHAEGRCPSGACSETQ